MIKKIVFMGTPNFSIPILKSIYQNGYPVSVVYTQPPQKSKRGHKINKSPIQTFSENLNYEIRMPNSLKNNKEEINFFKNLQPDLVIVVAYGQIIPREYLDLSKHGFINIHASILPKWRGAAPIQRSLINSDSETGISIMKISEKLDEGPVCRKFPIKINENENAEELSLRLSNLAAEKILDCLDDIFDENLEFVEQDHSKATYAKKIDKIEGKIDWNLTAEKILAKINGLYPFPGAWFTYKGERYKILKAEISSVSGKQGLILSDNFEIGCSSKSIKVLQIQREGKKVQSIKEFSLGTQLKKGSDLTNV
tara:strand:+ start:40 stop:969 length:930 start_codon:yes stop_codon:yes gene_type:complete